MKRINWKEIFTDKGFYLSLATGVVSITAFVLICVTMIPDSNKNSKNLPTPTPISNAALEDEMNKNETTETKVDPVKTATPKPTSKPKTVETNGKNNKKSNLSFDSEKGLKWPVKGDILMKFSPNNAIYFKTLAQYKTNPAIIIGCKEGDKVLSAADCVIESITQNEETGTTVTTSIGSNYKVIYGQVDNLKVKKGDTVKEGETIGTIAKPTKYYVEEGTNLYFQVTQKKENIDPLILLR